ncbi:hypothetical protein NMG60_11009934 [Bertholletia excelsa]
MAQVLNLAGAPATAVTCTPATRPDRAHVRCRQRPLQDWASVHRNLKGNGRITCLFSDNRKEEQARKALESALGDKKTEYEKWDKEIKRREEAGGGGDGGGGGWFRWGRWFGGSDGDHFWQEAQQAGLAILGIIVIYLIIAKGEVMLAFIVNPLLFVLRGVRNGYIFITKQVLQKVAPGYCPSFENAAREEVYTRSSAKESVVGKWGSNQ